MARLLLLAIATLAGCGVLGTRPVTGGAVPARWALAEPVTPDATELKLTVYEVPCSSGSPIEGRVEQPQIQTTATSVVITIRVRQLLGTQTCPLHPWPLTVQLGVAIGGRELLDGGRVPPAPPETP
jgi:hypothetical protein